MKVIFIHKARTYDYGGIHEFSPYMIMNVAKLHVCEIKGLDPRRIVLFKENEILTPIKRWAEKGFKSMPPQSFDPRKSFIDNKIKEKDRFCMVDDPSGYALCPICMEMQKPEFDSGFDTLTMKFCCKRCKWHWKVTIYEIGKVIVKDEVIHVILEASFGTIHREVPSNMRVEQVIETIVHRSCGIRKELNGRIVVPENIRVYYGEKELRKDLSLVEQGIHYSVYLKTK